MKTLVIVESGKKAKTIEKLLGDGYKVIACGGHIRDMPTKGDLGFDRNTLEIRYEMENQRKDWVAKIRKAINIGAYNHVILASDPDREGEAIAQSLKDEIGLQDHEYERCKFNEITKEAITKAIKGSDSEHSEKIDEHLVEAQETRRILDRYIGWVGTQAVTDHLYKPAPIGRVQAQALRFVVERERQIQNFVPAEYYNLKFISKSKAQENAIDQWFSKLDTVASGIASKVANGESESNVWLDGDTAKRLKAHLDGRPSARCIKSLIEVRSTTPPAPFTTTTMQQAAINNLGLSGKQIDAIAQELYQEGFITYPRTDSTRMSDEGYLLIQAWGLKNDVNIISPKRNFSADADAQDAHECIRPAIFDEEPTKLGDNHVKLYRLILARAVMSQMLPKEYEHRESHFSVNFEDKDYIFKAEGNITLKPGFTTYYKANSQVSEEDVEEMKNESDVSLPEFKEGETIEVVSGELKSAKTRPPSLFTQAKLNKKLDEHGIGRPSTYSSIFEKIVEHNYVEVGKSKKKAPEIKPTELGIEVVDNTEDVFKIMDPAYTREMEEKLDAIASNKLSKQEVAIDFLNEFDANVAQLAKTESKAVKIDCTVDGCDGYLLHYTRNKEGKPTNYWRCRKCYQVHFMQNGMAVTPENLLKPFLNDDGTPKYPCPECGSALRRIARKKGGFFWACSNNQKKENTESCEFAIDEYQEAPDFNNKGVDERRAEYIESLRKKGLVSDCPVCGHDMIERKGKKGKTSYHFVICDHCKYSNSADSKGKFSIKRAEAIAPYLDGETPKVPCPSCGAALFEWVKPIKDDLDDKPEYMAAVKCSGVFRKHTPCEFTDNDMTVEELIDKAHQYTQSKK